jgi:SAM-dependent methyltransferase
LARFVSDYSKESKGATPDGRFNSPAFHKNHQPILEVIRPHLAGGTGHVLEIGSGPGQHIAVYGKEFPDHVFWPSDPVAAHRESVAAWCAHNQVTNVKAPVELDAAYKDWQLGTQGRPPAQDLCAILCTNVFHIAPWDVAQGVLRGAGQHLAEDGALFVYGPFSRDGAHVSPSNADFDVSLRASNAQWGVRDTAEIALEGAKHALVLDQIAEMPSNNFVLVIKREKSDGHRP